MKTTNTGKPRKANYLTRLAYSVLAVALLSVGSSVWASTTPKLGIRANNQDARALVNVTIVVSPVQKIEKGTLLIENGKVSAVGSDVSIPDGVTIIDLSGYTIYPGLIDAYTNYGIKKPTRSERRREGRAPNYYGKRVGGNAWNDAIHSERNWCLEFTPDKKESESLMKQGFSAVQFLRHDGIFRGRSASSLLGEGLPNDLLIKPYGFHAVSFNKGSSQQDYPESLMGAIALIRQMFYDVEWYAQAHQALEKNPNQEQPEFNAAIEALSNVRNEKIILDGGTRPYSLYRLDRLREEFDLSLVGIANGYEYSRIDDVKGFGMALIVPLDFPKKPEISELEDDLDQDLASLRHWEMAPSNPASLEKAGVRFALSTHRLGKGGDFFKNLRLAIKRGLTEKTALAALTTVPAEICGISDLVGTLQPGSLANLIVCDGNLFDEERIIYSVWIAGDKNVIIPRPTDQFEGEYKLTVSDKEFTLVLRGKPDKIKGEISSGEFSEKLARFSADGNRISFAAKLDSADEKGSARFSGRKHDKTIAGDCLLVDGRMVSWSANWVGEPKSKEDKDSTQIKKDDKTEETPEEPEMLLSRLTYPNKAFGFETIPRPENVLVKNATVWTADDAGIMESTDILIRDGRFAKIGQGLTAENGVRVIDATGMHVTPGIIDAHAHIAGDGNINEGTHAISAEVRTADVVDPSSIHIYRQLAGGVTSSILMHGSANPIGGQNQVLKLRWGSNPEQLKFSEAKSSIKFALGENVKQSNWGERFTTRFPQSRMGVETIMRDVFQAAREYEKSWNAYHALSKSEKNRTIRPRKDIQLDAVIEVLHDQMIVHCHSYMASETIMLIRLAEEYGFTLDLFDHMLEGYKIADEIAAHGAGATTFSDWWAYKFEVYDAIPYNAGLLAERGVLTTMNSDNVELARRLNQEAGKAVMYNNMEQTEAIKLVTINSAIQLGTDHRTGSITIGKDADFVIWSTNPLSMYARAQQTWVDGALYYDIDRDKQMREEITDEKNALIQKIINSPSGKGRSPNKGAHKRSAEGGVQ